MLKEPVSDSVVRRLPRYYRYLAELERAGVERTSSLALGTQFGSTAYQFVRD
jgi:AT-rich DNA-binding protein